MAKKNKRTITKPVLKTDTSNSTILQHYGLDGSAFVKKSANFNSYFTLANEVHKHLSTGRLDAINHYDSLKKYQSLAESFSKEMWRDYLDTKYKDRIDHNETLYYNPTVPPEKLTRNGNIKPDVAKQVLYDLADQFDVVEDMPFFLKGLGLSLINAPKKIIAEMDFNSVGDHNRTCFVKRRILECTIPHTGNTYMLLSDEKFYENSPASVCTMSLLYGAEAKGVCQLCRVDTVAHLSPDTPDSLGLNIKYQMADYLLRKFNEHHHNAIPGRKFVKVGADHHIHTRDSIYELLYALSYISKSTIYRTNPIKFQHMNAKQIDESDFFIDNFSGRTKHQADITATLELFQKRNEEYERASIEHDGLITTDRLERYYITAHNITNQTINPDFCKAMDSYRTFMPKRICSIIDPAIVGTDSHPIYTAPADSKPIKQAIKLQGKYYVDYDYLLAHGLVEQPQEQSDKGPELKK